MEAKTAHQKPVTKATGHFWYQRITAITLIPLTVWVLVFMDKALNVPHAETEAWLLSPVNAAIIVVWVLAAFYHAALGVQVVLEDYVSTVSLRLWMIRFTNLIFLLLGIAALSAVVYIFLQGNYGLSL